VLPLLLVLALAGCEQWYDTVPSPDDLFHVVPWFDAMIGSPAVYPYETADVPRYTPAGIVPVTGAEADYEATWKTGNTTEADALVNPSPGVASARGDTLYHTFCATCHGPTGAGDGLVGRRMGAPSLLTDRARGFSDGYLYAIIRYGRGVMPPYGDKIHSPDHRWAVVNYLRALQSPAPGPAPLGQTPAGAAQ